MHRYNLRVNNIICDPLAKADKNNENTVWEKIDRRLNQHGFWLDAGSKAKEDGILLIKNYLMTINGYPALFFFEDCMKTISQCMNWTRNKDDMKPIKKNDDQPENLYRLMLLETQYEEVYEQSKSEFNRRDCNSMTGY